MLNLLNTWQFNLGLFIIFAVAFNQLYKFAAKNLIHDGAGTIILQVLAGILVLLLVPFFPMQFPTDWRIYLFLTIACIFYAINDRLQTTVRKNMEVSVFTILNRLSSVFLIIIGLTVFHEPTSFAKIIGAILILSTTFLLSHQHGQFKIDKYFVLIAIARLAVAIALSIDINISTHFNLPIYIMITLMMPALIIKVSEKIPIQHITAEFKTGNKKYFFLTSASWALFVVFAIRAYQFSTFSLITPLAATTVLINVFIATLFFGERKDIARKILAATITIIGAYLTII